MSLLELGVTLRDTIRESVEFMSLASLTTKDGETRAPKVHVFDLGYTTRNKKTFPAILIQPTEGTDELDNGIVTATYKTTIGIGVWVSDDEKEFEHPNKWDGWIWLYSALEGLRAFILQEYTFGAFTLEHPVTHGLLLTEENTRPILWGYIEANFSGAGMVRERLDEKEW